MDVSNTPRPPGTWLMSPMICASRYAPDEGGERQTGHGREDRIEDRSRQEPVEGRERELGGGDARPRQVDAEAMQQQRPAPEEGESGVPGGRRQQRPTDGPAGVEGQLGARGERPERVDHATQQQEAQPERDQRERDHARDVVRLDSPGREHAVADGAPPEPREPDVVAEDVGHEGRERDAAVAERVLDVPEGEGVVEGQHEVAERGEDERRQHVAEGDRSQVPEDVLHPVRPELAAQDEAREDQQADAQRRAEDRQQPLPNRCGSAAHGVVCLSRRIRADGRGKRRLESGLGGSER